MTKNELTFFFFTIVLLLSVAHAMGYLCERLFRLPRVVGEIGAGILLGASALGQVSPDLYAAIFTAFPSETKLLSTLQWIGLTLLMFGAGFRVRQDLGTQDRSLVLFLTLAATGLPFLAGLLVSKVFDLSHLAGPSATPTAFSLVVAVAAAVTSIPVISRIMMDLGLMETRFARVVLTVATIDDILLWAVLAVATGLAETGASSTRLGVVGSVVVPVIFISAAIVLGPPLLRRLTALRMNLIFKASPIGYVLLVCFSFSALASMLDVNIAFGALAAGIVVGSLEGPCFEKARAGILDVSLGFFVPIYFVLVGTKIDLAHHFDPALVLGFLVATSLVKMAGVMIGAWLARITAWEGLNFAMALNCRGGPGIVLATVALEFAMITETMFTALIIASLATAIMSGAWLRAVVSRGLSLDAKQPSNR